MDGSLATDRKNDQGRERYKHRAKRPALEATFHHWRDHMAPYHFQRTAFTRYPREYAAAAKLNRRASPPKTPLTMGSSINSAN